MDLGIHTHRVDELSMEVQKRLRARTGIHMVMRAIEEGLLEPRVPPPALPVSPRWIG
jgi:hypothetical protein